MRNETLQYSYVSSRATDPLHLNADPDPAFHCNTDPAFHFNANPDPDPAPHQRDANQELVVYRSSRAPF